MKIFISWSGDKSKRIAEAFKEWLPCVIQSLVPYVSSEDIDKGARWSADLAEALQNTSFGILCVTRESISSPWLNYEAGALSKLIDKARVCPFLLGIKKSEIKDSPILQFQMTTAVKDDVFKLVNSINDGLGDSKLNESILRASFDVFWPKLEADLKEISALPDTPKPAEEADKDSSALIEEILDLVRNQQKRLNSPNELIPPEYLQSIISGCIEKASAVRSQSARSEKETRIPVTDGDADCEDGRYIWVYDASTGKFRHVKKQDLDN